MAVNIVVAVVGGRADGGDDDADVLPWSGICEVVAGSGCCGEDGDGGARGVHGVGDEASQVCRKSYVV